MSDLGKDTTLAHVDSVLEAIADFTEVVKRNEHSWHWKKLRSYADGLFARAPFKPGDRVRLIETPTINAEVSWGLLGSKHFMVKGALGTVQAVDFSEGHFEAWVVMDDETYLGRLGQKHKPDRPTWYHFWDTKIERVP